MDNSKEYYVFSLYTIAYLMNEGIEVNRIDEVNGKVAFIFDNSEELRKVLDKKRNDKWFDNYIENYKAARQMMFNKRDNRKGK